MYSICEPKKAHASRVFEAILLCIIPEYGLILIRKGRSVIFRYFLKLSHTVTRVYLWLDLKVAPE